MLAIKIAGWGYKARATYLLIREEAGWQYREIATGHDAMVTESERLSEMLMEVTTAARRAWGKGDQVTSTIFLPTF